jgi:hypothetical protein
MSPKLDLGTCAKLRTKTMYLNVEYRSDGDEPGSRGTAVYWCLKTHGPLGPDELPVCPEDCRASRACAVVRPEA